MRVADRDLVARLEAEDPLPTRRAEFLVPPWPGGTHAEWAYFAGNSLGLQPRAAATELRHVLDDWAGIAVERWFESEPPWLDYASRLRPSIAPLVGASPDEVVAMNALTVNLHLLLASFYRPVGERTRIIVEDAAFPSDAHAIQTHAMHHGLDPAATIVRLAPRDGEHALRTGDIADAIEREGSSLALVLLGAVNYLTGELVDVPTVTAATHAVGAVSGWDLAHAIGNVVVPLHDAGADFAVWCHYKYVNGGPGAPGGAFVHARHAGDTGLPRLGGWWGVDPDVRFGMEPDFVPQAGADGWAVSTPSIVALAPLRAALAQFDDVGIDALRGRSIRLTGYLETLLDEVAAERAITVTTPRDPAARGCQLSVAVDDAKALAATLRAKHGVICDFREPSTLRFAPVPLYSTYEDCRRGAEALLTVTR